MSKINWFFSGVLAFGLASDFASAGMAKAMGGEAAIDATRLPVCLGLPGSGATAQSVMRGNHAAAEAFSANDQSCTAVLKRAGFDL